MIFVITIFYISILAILSLLLAKQREETLGSSKFLDSINRIFERRLRVTAFVIGNVFMEVLVPSILHWVKNFTQGVASSFIVLFRQAKRELSDIYKLLVNRVQLDKGDHRRGAVSFFLKDITDYKNNLSEGKRTF